jgi:hypothetical protein
VEVDELQMLANYIPLPIRDHLTSVPGKVNCLLQVFFFFNFKKIQKNPKIALRKIINQ